MIAFDPTTTKKPTSREAFDMIGALPPEVKWGVRHLLWRIWGHTSNDAAHPYFGTAWESIKRLAAEMGYTDIADLFAEAEKLGVVGREHHFQMPGKAIAVSANYQEGIDQGLGEYVGSRYWVIWAKVKELARKGIGKIPTPFSNGGIGKFPTPKESTPYDKWHRENPDPMASGKLASENSRPSIYPNTASASTEKSRTDAAAAVTADTGARKQTDAADGDNPNTGAAATDATTIVVSPDRETCPTNPPDTGRMEGLPSGDVQSSAAVEFSIDPVTVETAKQVRKQSQKEYAIEKSEEFRKLPQSVRAQVSGLRKRCRVEWDYMRTHEEDGKFITDEADYNLSVFESPTDSHLCKLAELLEKYTESQIFGAWKKFLKRPKGVSGLDYVWVNFFREFEDHVEVEPGDGGGAA
jgi:hypothetical protein